MYTAQFCSSSSSSSFLLLLLLSFASTIINIIIILYHRNAHQQAYAFVREINHIRLPESAQTFARSYVIRILFRYFYFSFLFARVTMCMHWWTSSNFFHSYAFTLSLSHTLFASSYTHTHTRYHKDEEQFRTFLFKTLPSRFSAKVLLEDLH